MSKRIIRTRVLLLFTTVLAIGWITPVVEAHVFQEGGLEDLNTGLVWSRSQIDEQGVLYTWSGAQVSASRYAVSDYDAAGQPVLYDDWRMATL